MKNLGSSLNIKEVYEPEEIKNPAASKDKISKSCEKMIWQARMDANKIVVRAEEFAKRMLDQASKKANNELIHARENGYLEGLETGKAQAMEQIDFQLAELSALIKSIEQQKAALLEKHEQNLKAFALELAKKIINTELQANDQAFLALYKSAIQELNTQDWVKVTVSGCEASFATSYSELLQNLTQEAKSIKVTVIENAPPGTCIVETPQSIADASVQTQMSRLQEAFSRVDLIP
jgi:flagellar assembly protein FliH